MAVNPGGAGVKAEKCMGPGELSLRQRPVCIPSRFTGEGTEEATVVGLNAAHTCLFCSRLCNLGRT